MQDLKIEVDILCEWQTEPQAYRLYINDDLYTERTYVWRNPNQWVREMLVLPVNGKFHGFKLANFAINDKLQDLENGTFTV